MQIELSAFFSFLCHIVNIGYNFLLKLGANLSMNFYCEEHLHNCLYLPSMVLIWFCFPFFSFLFLFLGIIIYAAKYDGFVANWLWVELYEGSQFNLIFFFLNFYFLLTFCLVTDVCNDNQLHSPSPYLHSLPPSLFLSLSLMDLIILYAISFLCVLNTSFPSL